MADLLIRTRLHDGVAIVLMDNPPVNALSAALLAALAAILDRLEGQAGVRAIVLLGEGDGFSAGTDIREIGKPAGALKTGDLCNRIEACKVPVIAALQGAALGGGADIALACHYRIADGSALIGFPEVTLGVIPGAGGTQRLPRLVGAARALDLMLGGRPIPAAQAQKFGIVDGVVDGHLPSAALRFTQDLLAKGKGPRPTRLRTQGFDDAQGYLSVIADRRRALAQSRMNAPKRIVDAVEAALLLPFDAGLALEAAALADCVAHDQSRALRHMFLAERRIDPGLLAENAKGLRVPTDAGSAVIDRLRAALRVAVDHIATLGVAPARIDAALLKFGFAEGPFGGTDPSLTGRDIALIQSRCVAAIMAEGARMVERGQVARASDIDALAVHGMGFPRFRGGPMKAAHLIGLLNLRHDMTRWAQESRIWAAPPLLSEAIKYADGFEGIPEGYITPAESRP